LPRRGQRPSFFLAVPDGLRSGRFTVVDDDHLRLSAFSKVYRCKGASVGHLGDIGWIIGVGIGKDRVGEDFGVVLWAVSEELCAAVVDWCAIIVRNAVNHREAGCWGVDGTCDKLHEVIIAEPGAQCAGICHLGARQDAQANGL
jgi:hypothetical protein